MGMEDRSTHVVNLEMIFISRVELIAVGKLNISDQAEQSPKLLLSKRLLDIRDQHARGPTTLDSKVGKKHEQESVVVDLESFRMRQDSEALFHHLGLLKRAHGFRPRGQLCS